MGLPSRMVSSLHVPPLFWQGQVKARLESGQLEVDCGERCWIVPQAVSCLVQPQVGYKVWVGGADGEQAYVFAVLERPQGRSEEHTSELQSREILVCRLLLEK